MSDLLEKQFLFSRLVVRLIAHINVLGLECTLGEVWRSPEQATWNATQGKGIVNSLHKDRLAIDLNLFTKEGKFLSTTEDHRQIGEWWETQNPLCRWGGHFTRADGNHYSITYQGRS